MSIHICISDPVRGYLAYRRTTSIIKRNTDVTLKEK